MCKVISILSFTLIANLSFAGNEVLVLSGGDNPGLNHYSQYLQTKTIYNYATDKYGSENTTLYFGMGNNNTGENPFPDVHQIKVESDGVRMDYMIPGVIANNQQANMENVLSYFLSPKITNLTPNDNLLLFVSDHGLPQLFMDQSVTDRYSDNCIDLWHFDGHLVNNFVDSNNFSKVCLSKNVLKTMLENVKAKHIVFEMSQCFSGGFHQMSVTWQNGYPHANPKICGFTAATPDHYASGCTADADGPAYQGYERSFTEWFTGKGIATGKDVHKPAANIWDAHNSAILEDMTVDTPISTSDYYLLQWADTFNNSDFKSRVSKYNSGQIKKIFNNYQNYLSGSKAKDLLSFVKLTELYNKKVIGKYPSDKGFFNLSLSEQEKYINQLEKNISEMQQQNMAQFQGVDKIYNNVILPKWSEAIKSHKVTELNTIEYKMESELYLKVADKANNLSNDTSGLMFNVFFLQYLALNNNDQMVYNYSKNRNTIISKWAEANKLSDIVNANKYLVAFQVRFDKNNEKISALEQEKQLLKRAYLYRKVIAAWITLEQINDIQALNELSGLIDCQHYY